MAPQIKPSAALHLSVPAIGVDAQVLPVEPAATGERNELGGQLYEPVDFPVDAAVRQWVQRGDPNSLPAAESASDPKAFDRTILYGHASDIGNHLVFQDLSALRPHDRIIVTTAAGVFTYQVTLVATNEKSSLENMPELYGYPASGRKEIALVACLPDTTSNAVVIGELVSSTAR